MRFLNRKPIFTYFEDDYSTMTNSTILSVSILAFTVFVSSCQREFEVSTSLPEITEPVTCADFDYSVKQKVTLAKDGNTIYSGNLFLKFWRVTLSEKIEWIAGNLKLLESRLDGMGTPFYYGAIPYKANYYCDGGDLHFEIYQTAVFSKKAFTNTEVEVGARRPRYTMSALNQWLDDTTSNRKDTLLLDFGRIVKIDSPFAQITLKYHFKSKGDKLLLIDQKFENPESFEPLKEIFGSDAYSFAVENSIPRSIKTLSPTSCARPNSPNYKWPATYP